MATSVEDGAVTFTRSRRRATFRAVPWLIPIAASVGMLHEMSVPGRQIMTYALYFVGCVVLPGVLLLRAFWRSTGSWAEDIGLGAAAGLCYELCGWALFTAFDRQEYLIAWPLLLMLHFLLVPGLRRHWRIADPMPPPMAWTWALVLGATASLVLLVSWSVAPTAVPPEGIAYYQDTLYHLSMVHELVRAVPPELPQVAGQSLDYHWFANAHMAAAVDITGIPAERVVLRLWILPPCIVLLLIFAALARQVSKVWWSGVITTGLLFSAQYVNVWAKPVGISAWPVSIASPSLTYGVLIGTVAAVVLIDILYRGHRGRRAWVLLLVLAFVGGGAKPTTLPLLLAGTGLAALFLLLRDGRVPWRSVVAGIALLAATLLTLLTVAGSTSGSRLRLFGFLLLMKPYVAATGDGSLAAGGGWTLPAFTDGDALAVGGALLALAALLVSQVCTFTAFGVLVVGRTRRDPVAWWLAGSVIAGWLGMLLLDHPAGSELYFLRSVVPFSAVATAWLLTSVFRRRMRVTVLVLGAIAVGVGASLVQVARSVAPTPVETRQSYIAALGWPMLVLVVGGLLCIPLWFTLRRVWPTLAGLGGALAVLSVIGALIPSSAYFLTNAVRYRMWATAVSSTEVGYQVHPDEQRAAMWLRTHSRPRDVVASNTACRPARRQPPGCDARGYIVSGIAGRRVLLEGWAYTQQSLATQGTDGKGYSVQPAPWQDRMAVIEELFSEPTAETITRLRTEYGVRWVYADLLAGTVPSERLEGLAVLRHAEPSVEIYELAADPSKARPDVAVP